MTIYNNVSNLKDFDYPKARRSKIYIGSKCSYKCIFCFYKNHRNDENCNNVYEQLNSVRKYGIYDLDFTGGEPTEDNNFINYIKYAKNLNFRQIAVITNGCKFSNISYLKECKEAGLNEVLFSLHGYNKFSHDKITGINGSFNNIITAIENAKKLNLLIRFNTTICEDNIEKLDSYHSYLVDYYKPVCQNYLILNFWDDNKDYNFNIDYKYIGEKLKSTINNLDQNNIKYICIRYFPYCYLVGYEKYLVNKYQHIYDYFDWNVELESLPNINYDVINSKYGYYSYSKSNLIRTNFYSKQKECLKCKYAYICDGILNKVEKNNSLYPISGEYIKDPLYYIKDYQSENKYLETINNYVC